MKRIYILSLLGIVLFLLVSCTDYIQTAKDYYLSGQFELAKKELSKIKETDSEFEKALSILKKIDSTIYEEALKEFSYNNFEKSSEILSKINNEGALSYEKNQLYKKISFKMDSLEYQEALKLFSNNFFDKSKALLNNINDDSPYKDDRIKLEEKIVLKRKKNAIKEKFIAKAVISSVFGPSPSIMKVENDNSGIYIITYYSRDAGRNYSYKVRFEGNRAYWGADDGEWRYDDLNYSETQDAYYITEKFGDGSTRRDKFYKNSLK